MVDVGHTQGEKKWGREKTIIKSSNGTKVWMPHLVTEEEKEKREEGYEKTGRRK